MVGSLLQGGLGNYMFQIAAAYSLAIDNKDESLFDLKSVVQVHNNISTYRKNIFRFVNFSLTTPYVNVYHEPTFNYNPIPYQKDLILIGYFQSEKYFNHNRNPILSLFSPTYEDLGYIHDKYGSLLDKDTCSIHVRRGDYVKLKDHHPPCDMGYYEKAMAMIPEGTKFLIFYDDMVWCKDKFKGDQFVFIEDETDVVDLFLMTYCDNNIIANSTFSWWGAWLNDNENKKVISPKKWFGPSKGNIITEDVYPKNWVKL